MQKIKYTETSKIWSSSSYLSEPIFPNWTFFIINKIRIPGGMVIKLAEVVESGSLGGTMFPKPCIGTRAWNGDKHRWTIP